MIFMNQWKVFLYKEAEAASDPFLCKWIATQSDVHICSLESDAMQEDVIGRLKRAGFVTQEALFLSATDETLQLAQSLKIAPVAFINKDYPNQTYAGVEILIEGFEEVDTEFLNRIYLRYHRQPWQIVETNRCIVRELMLEDLPQLEELYQSDGVTEYVEPLFEHEKEYAYQKAYIEHMYRYFGYGMWLVFQKETGRLIGRAGLEHREYEQDTLIELGYLIEPGYQRQGYATEVCEAILKYAREQLELASINCFIQEGNQASIHLAYKLGFQKVSESSVNSQKMYRFLLIF